MPIVIPIDFAEVVIPLTHSAVVHVASVTFGVSTVGGAPFSSALADDILTSFSAAFSPVIDDDVLIGPVRATVGQDGAPLVVEGTIDTTGARSVLALPPNCCVLIKKRGSLGGKRGRGRFFLPWAVAAGETNEAGTITSTVVTAVQAAATTFLADLAGSVGAPMVVLHSTGISTVPEPAPVTTLTVDSLISTQRRRLGR